MKRIIISVAIVSVMALAGCSTTTTSENIEQSSSVETSQPNNQNNEPSQAPVVTEETVSTPDAQEVLQQYLDRLLEKDYEGLAEFVHVDTLNMTKDEYINAVRENDFKNSMERYEYLISDISDYDNDHKHAKILFKGKTTAGDFSVEDSLGIVLVEDKWKIEVTMVVKKEDIPIEFTNEYVKINRVEKITKLNGYHFNIYYNNIMKDNDIMVGWMNNSNTELTTEAGVVTAILGEANVQPQTEGSFSIFFETDSKSTAQHITINNLYVGDNKGLPIPGRDPFKLDIPLQ